MAVSHLLFKSFWATEAIFQLMMLAYNLFLLFKMDMVKTTEYRQQIKTFRLRYVFFGREDHQYCKKCGHEALGQIPLSKDLCTKTVWMKRISSYTNVVYLIKLSMKNRIVCSDWINGSLKNDRI